MALVRPTIEELNAGIDEVIPVLDELAPGWRNKIDLDNFDIFDPSKCVLFYAMGGYLVAEHTIKNAAAARELDPFLVSDAFADSRGQAHWIERILERDNQG